MTHRDPAEVVGSICSLIKHVRGIFSDQVDLARSARHSWTPSQMIDRADAFSDQHGADAIHDVQYADAARSDRRSAQALRATSTSRSRREAEAAMTAYMADNQQGKHGKHVYDLAEFGLTEAGVRDHFGDYCERYRILVRATVA